MTVMPRRARRLRRSLWLLLLVGLFSAFAGEAQDERRIEWLDLEFPPFYIHDGPARGQGIADGICRMIRQEMEDWSHTRKVASLEETMRRMRAGDQVCSGAFLKTEARETFLHFSIPNMLLPPNGITVRRGDVERFGGGGEVALGGLLQDDRLRLAVVQGRAYGDGVDALLKIHGSSSHVYAQVGQDIYGSIFEMLLKGTVDYVIGYPHEALYLAHQAGRDGEVLNLPIAENRDYVPAHVICPKTDWGAGAILAIDAAIRRLRDSEEYRAAIERWLDDGLRPEFRRRYSERMAATE